MNDRDFRKNSEGYLDLTFYRAMINIERDSNMDIKNENVSFIDDNRSDIKTEVVSSNENVMDTTGNEKIDLDKNEKKHGRYPYNKHKNQDAATYRFYKLINVIYHMCDVAGFHVAGRIQLKDKKTGKIYR